jgi:hypothetical protein
MCVSVGGWADVSLVLCDGMYVLNIHVCNVCIFVWCVYVCVMYVRCMYMCVRVASKMTLVRMTS